MRQSIFVLAALFVGLSSQASIKSRVLARSGKLETLPRAVDDIETNFQSFLTSHGKSVKDLAQYAKKLAKYRKKVAKLAEHNKDSVKYGWTQAVN